MQSAFGTSSLNRHKCPAPATQTSISNHAMTLTVNAEAKKAAKRAHVALALFSEDLHPFKITEGGSFMAFAQTMLDIGLKSRARLLAKDVLAQPTTVQRALAVEAKEARAMLKPRLQAHPISSTSFISLTCSYITYDWKLVDQVLGVRSLSNEPHTAIFIKNETSSILKEYGIFSTTPINLDAGRHKPFIGNDGPRRKAQALHR
ncbi:hypothetical protein SDRG_12563 [Saprolegnia diclina VS20]|uniref:Uncharacterized protein n=1 Tax=Saprolegnia diclina (strain VS20) TaxID=1156394 RepID=T0RIT8_SAPDV|nr:hypothetical protein SDRG_12563 [Saprolegnia diclina VS20]EQC29792.1 hypothetical protein SDRG_12563 [Saprolegnia diclina VS20]|eukprot:XP_008616858.1 hypothetical protein SDRG_12563 [Saprolegnia diclina VS20]